MLIVEKDAGLVRCCGPEECGFPGNPVLVVGSDGTDERVPLGYVTPRFCVGAQCAAWRWHKSNLDKEARGWCGLAGRPDEARS